MASHSRGIDEMLADGGGIKEKDNTLGDTTSKAENTTEPPVKLDAVSEPQHDAAYQQAVRAEDGDMDSDLTPEDEQLDETVYPDAKTTGLIFVCLILSMFLVALVCCFPSLCGVFF